MPCTIACPSCQKSLHLPDDLVGRLVRCPTCGQAFMTVAPGPAAAEAGAPLPVLPAEEPGALAVQPVEPARPPPRRQQHRGGLILVLGGLSLTACGLFGPFAWIMANHDLHAMKAGRMDPAGEGSTRAGRVCAIVGTLKLPLEFLFLGWVAWVVYQLVSEILAIGS